MEIKLSKRAILTPLIGLVVAWTFFMFAFYSELFVLPIYDSQGMYQGEAPVIRPSTYLFLAAIVVFGLLALSGQRMALRAREIAGPENSLARAAHRFGNLAVIIALASGAAYAIGNFLGAFTAFSDREENLLVRLFDVYIPILLATGLVVYILLRAFVFRKQVAKGAKKEGMSESERALGLGYAVPIIATAIAIIFGLVVYDVTRTDLQIWVWVIIQVIVVSGILLGTRFSTKAKTAKTVVQKPRATLAAGAANLNFVLSIVFGAVVSIMAFTFGGAAIESLRTYPKFEEPKVGENTDFSYTWQVSPPSITWFIEEMLPALVLLFLAAAGIYLSITERNNFSVFPQKPVSSVGAKKAELGKTSSKKTTAKPATKPATKSKAKPK